MKNRIPIAIVVLALLASAVVSCDKNSAKVSGNLAGVGSRSVLLEQVTSDGVLKIDSTETNRNGFFKLSVKLPESGTTLYNIRIGSDKIPLFISAGEKIKITSTYGLPGRYDIEGSRESALVKELNDILSGGSRRLDSLAAKLSGCTSVCPKRAGYINAYLKEYGNLKREQIKFIITNSGSLASLYALYQRLPNDQTLFSGKNDIIYYRLVADSVSKYYPGSPYLAALMAEIDSVDSQTEMSRILSEKMENLSSYPDIALPDLSGRVRNLSDSEGKVILLDFWSAASKDSPLNNAELKELYSEFSSKGFEIYQVCLDTSKPLWMNAVQSQSLPWISVCDFKGMDGIAPKVYNVQSVSTNYLINRKGEIIGKNLTPVGLRARMVGLIAEQ